MKQVDSHRDHVGLDTTLWNDQIDQAVFHLKNGGVIAYPTEAVYGLGCDPWSELAFIKLLHIKQRPIEKGVIMIAYDIAQVESLIDKASIAKERWQEIIESWPGPFTWIFPAKHNVPDWIKGAHHSVAIRIPSHEIARELCKRFGSPIVSTSANISNQPAISKLPELIKQFTGKIDYIIHANVGTYPTPSQIRDAVSGAVLRK